MPSLWGITCYFNPIGYRRRLENYLAFRHRLGVPLVAVELGYRDAFDLPDDAADVLIRLRGGDTLWQKERLLNVALRELPPDCSAVAWLDCDIVFEREDWAERSLAALERYPLLQPFHSVREPAPGDPEESMHGRNGLGRSIARLLDAGDVMPEILGGDMRVDYRTHSGLAWVGRRDVLDADGFYDACVMGSGNRAMICAALGRAHDAVGYLQMTPAWTRHYVAWAERHFHGVRGAAGCIEGTVVHLWHGDLAKRRYRQRHVEFRRFDYDPSADVAVDETGCWRWSTDKRAMHDYVADYFRSRRKDGE